MLELSIPKIAQVVLFAHEFERAESELRAFIEGFNEDEHACLLALMWIGRGNFSADELHDALRLAYSEPRTPIADYLIGTPHMADHLENGLAALGLSAANAEAELL